MSKRIKGITIEIDGETKGLDKALSNVNKESFKLQKELKDVERLLKFNPGNTELLAQKQKLLGDQVNTTREKLDRLKSAQDDVNKAFENGEISEEQYRAFQREIVDTEGKLKSLESQLDQSKTKLQSVADGFEKAGNKMKSVGDKVTGAGKTLTAGVTAPIVALGGLSVKTAADFESAMSRVGAVSGATGEDFQKLEKLARDMGATTQFSASEAADGLNFMAMAGYDTEQMISSLPGVLNLAAAGGTDLAIASDIVTDAMTGLGMGADETNRFVDIMAATITKSNTNVEMMGETMKYVAPVAGALGINMEDLSVATGLMANAGIKGSQAGTALRAGLTRLVDPPRAAANVMDDLGISIQKNADGSINMAGMMEHLRDRLGGMDNAAQAAAISTIFGQEAMAGWASIVNASEEDFNGLTEAIQNSDGRAEDIAKTMNDNLNGSLKELRSAMEEAAISIGEVLIPFVRKLTVFLNDLFNRFNQLSPSAKALIVLFGAIAAAIGPILLVLGTMISVMGNAFLVIAKILPHLAKLRTAFTVIRTAMLALTGPIGLTIAIITALAIAIYKNWDTVKAKTIEVFNFLRAWIPQTFNTLKAAVVGIAQSIVTGVVGRFNAIRHGIALAIQGASNLAIAVFNVMRNAVIAVAVAIATGVVERFNAIRAGVAAAVTAVSNVVRVIFNALRAYILAVVTAYRTIFTTGFNAIRSVVSSISNGIRSVAVAAFNGLRAGIAAAVNGVRSVVSSVFGAVRSLTSSLLNGARSAGISAFNSLRSGVSSAVNGVRSVVSSVFSGIRNLITNPIEAAKNSVLRIIDQIKGAFSRMNITIPKPKLPRISVSTGSKEVAGVSIPFPKFSVDWYKKGGVFGNASIIGVGEEPGVSEAVIPLKPSVLAQIGQGIANSMGGGGMGGPVELVINLDGYEIARATQPYIDSNQQSRTNMKSYMRGVKG